ncbi:MAG: LysM peptidoglycan-binding domain-containing protein [Treponema sp.]|jgi:nucleoid-associated protein YgaU|nr:LysM peptidoglycan-binding domain-containing protein [Treponema sp.]
MKTNKRFLSGTLFLFITLLVAGHVFAQTSVDDITKNLTDNFILYERYLPNTQLNQLRAIRNRIISRPDEVATVIDAMRDFIVECDDTAYQNVLTTLSDMGKKDERLSSYQSRYEVQELHRRFLTLNQKAQISLDEIRSDINAIDSLYDALDQQYADLVVLSGVAESTYVVQSGDSLRGIADRLYGVASRWRDIYALNQDLIQNPDFILPNMVLRLPVSESQQPPAMLSDPYSGQSLVAATRPAPSSNSYYVKAGGNDANNGFTEDTAFKTLAQAVQAASSGSIKTITVLGRLEINSERDIIKDAGAAEITITGSATEPATLAPWDLFCSVTVQGNSNIRFEQITIRGFDNGGLVVLQDAMVTLGVGARITANNSYGGGGLRIKNGRVIMQNGAEIVNNEYSELYENMGGYGAGVELDGGSFIMMEGSRIAGNIAHGLGGGVYISAGSFVMRGGSISGNQSKRARGGGVYVAGGSFEVSGGEISGNIGDSGDAVYIAQAGSFSNRGGMIATAIVDERVFNPIVPPATPSVVSLARYDSHTIQPGEYLRMIAARVYGDETRWPEIYRANRDNILDPDFILPNSVLQIPRPEVSEPIASMLGIAQAPAQSASVASQSPILAGVTTYYVMASGNDTNNGLSEAESFKTLTRALTAASGSSIKKVTVIGTLEMTDIDILTIQNTGADEIIISGKSNVGETAILRRRSDSQWWKTLTISGNSNIRFEYITISGGAYGGLVIQDATVTLGPGARVRDNTSAYGGGGGVYIANGKFTMLEGSEISNNASKLSESDERIGYGGGVVLESGSFTMMGGTITGNTAETTGGGVYVEGGSFVMVNGRITGNSSRFAGGAVYVAGGSFVMTGAGVVANNIAQYGAGVYVDDGTSVMINGSISSNTGDYGDAVYIGLKGSFKQLGGSIEGAQENTSIVDAADAMATAGSGGSSYYVSASGNDANEGTRENSALRTLTKALELAKQSNVKVITVIGVQEGTMRIENMGELEILITGKAQASEREKAVFNGSATEPAFDISGQSKIRVEHITVSAGAGGSFRIRDREASLTLGTKTRIFGTPDMVTVGMALENDATLIMCDDASISNINTSSSAVYVAKGTFTMTDNALIAGNSTQANGGGVHIRDGVFTMQGSAKISGNKSDANGGGVCIDQGLFSMQENASILDNTALGYGGGVFMNQVSQETPSFIMRGMALISGNTAANLGGGVYIIGEMSLWGNTRILDNAALSGGGVAISANSSLSLWENTKITANQASGADNFGGGILGLDKTSRITLGDNAILSGNIADYGGGAATFGTIVGETNIAITANRALKGGGGVVFLFKSADELQEEDTARITPLFEKVHSNIAPGDPKETDIALRRL